MPSYAFFMQAIPDTTNGATFLSNVLPVKAGDKVSVTIGFQKATKVATFRFINLTTNQTRIYNKTLPNGMLGKEADFVFEHNHFDGDPLAYLNSSRRSENGLRLVRPSARSRCKAASSWSLRDFIFTVLCRPENHAGNAGLVFIVGSGPDHVRQRSQSKGLLHSKNRQGR